MDDKTKEILEQGRYANQLGEKVFFHISLISVGVFSLLIPFVQSLKHIKPIRHPNCFVIIGALITITIIGSVVRNFLAYRIYWYTVEKNTGDESNSSKKKKMGIANGMIQNAIIVTFTLTLVFTVFFVFINILYKPPKLQLLF